MLKGIMYETYRTRPDWRALYRTYFLGCIIFTLVITFGFRVGGFVVLLFFGTAAALTRLRYEYVIEDARISIHEGLFSRNVREIRIKHIRGLQVRQNLIERILNVGTLVAVTAADEKLEIRFWGIRNPGAVKELINGRIG